MYNKWDVGGRRTLRQIIGKQKNGRPNRVCDREHPLQTDCANKSHAVSLTAWLFVLVRLMNTTYGRGFESCHKLHLYVTKKITCQKSPKFRTFLRIWTLKFYSQNHGSPKGIFWTRTGVFSFSREPRADLDEIFQSLLFFIAKIFHKVSDGFLFVMPN